MISEKEARQLVLDTCNPNETGGEWIISECFSSPKDDFWVIRGNTKAWIDEKKWEAQLVGVNAYLVNKESGQMHVVISAFSVEEFIQDLYDERGRGGKVYALCCANPGDKREIIRMRSLLNCMISLAKSLFDEHYYWVTGRKQHLEGMKAFLAGKGINSRIDLIDPDKELPVIRQNHWGESDYIKLIKERLGLSTGRAIIQPERGN